MENKLCLGCSNENKPVAELTAAGVDVAKGSPRSLRRSKPLPLLDGCVTGWLTAATVTGTLTVTGGLGTGTVASVLVWLIGLGCRYNNHELV